MTFSFWSCILIRAACFSEPYMLQLWCPEWDTPTYWQQVHMLEDDVTLTGDSQHLVWLPALKWTDWPVIYFYRLMLFSSRFVYMHQCFVSTFFLFLFSQVTDNIRSVWWSLEFWQHGSEPESRLVSLLTSLPQLYWSPHFFFFLLLLSVGCVYTCIRLSDSCACLNKQML